ncbi:MAG: exodeoxyribonuclease VII large subunit [Gammaproteobacteria bacterium]|nr:exodeoxyribonuclease VII large subunit [Gammaproteobacteria bacterium]
MSTQSDHIGTSTPEREIYSVSGLTQIVREILEDNFPLIWLEGEISNLAKPSSGHIYFSLKDESSQVRCAMFRMRNRILNFTPENGMQVLVRARVSLYEARGEFQLIIEHMEESGDGALRRAFEKLKLKLANEGLFDEENKQALPQLPKSLGVITSPSGAAIQDILSILERRFPSIPVKIYPVPVQGKEAAKNISSMIQYACQQKQCDVLILSRGGGSLEDLWAFNDESVARAIYKCTIPVVTGIGHEIDFTIADFVADQRAATPSAAAELVSPDRLEWLQGLNHLEKQLHKIILQLLNQKSQILDYLQKRLQHPGRRLQMQAQRIDELEQRLSNAQFVQLRHINSHLNTVFARLNQHTPIHKLRHYKSQHDNISHRLKIAIKQSIYAKKQLIANTSRALDAVSPLATLGRGYAIVRKWPDQTLIQTSRNVSLGDKIEARLKNGRLICNVEKTLDD